MKECLYWNAEKKFSRLGQVTNNLKRFQIEPNKYEFLLEYPDINKSNHWTQTVFPTSAKEGSDIGYEEIYCDLKDNLWGGLAVSSKCSIIDGSPGRNSSWFYPICQHHIYAEGFECITNPTDPYNQPSCVRCIKLWIKMNNKFFLLTKKSILNISFFSITRFSIFMI